MKKRNFIVGLFVLALIVVATATGASSDQGRRLAGPFCVGKANLSPFFVKKVGWVSRAGVVRSVAVTEQCQSWELRKFGQPDNDAATEGGVPGPAGPQGDTGAAGKDGKSITITSTEKTEGGTTVTFSDGTSIFVADGAPGPKGDKGDTGATGATGPAGPAGKDGTNGEGGDNDDVQQGLAVCASNGGNLKLCGGDNGHDPVGYLILAGSSS